MCNQWLHTINIDIRYTNICENHFFSSILVYIILSSIGRPYVYFVGTTFVSLSLEVIAKLSVAFLSYML